MKYSVYLLGSCINWGEGEAGRRVPKEFACEKKNVFKWIHLSGRFHFFRSKQQALLAHRRCFTGEKSRWIHASENPANDSVYKPEEAWNPGDVTPSREIWQHKPSWREEGSALGIIAAWLQRNGMEPEWEIISFDID